MFTVAKYIFKASIGALLTIWSQNAFPQNNFREFSQVGNWTLLKYPEGCAMMMREFDAYLWVRFESNQVAFRIISDKINLVPGVYPIGFSVGNAALKTTNTINGSVFSYNTHSVQVLLSKTDATKILNEAYWVEFILGDKNYLMNLHRSDDALRVLPVCETHEKDPFSNSPR